MADFLIGEFLLGLDTLGSVVVGAATACVAFYAGSSVAGRINTTNKYIPPLVSSGVGITLFIAFGPPLIALVPGANPLAAELGMISGVSIIMAPLVGLVQLYMAGLLY